ncbi:MAG TPA: hypothetical protein VE912_01475 [Bacteroidales bacterium]|nr:hypothetical protein [Bacteroidales bacterium]
MSRIFWIAGFTITILMIGSCANSENGKQANNTPVEATISQAKSDTVAEADSLKSGLPIFYNMYLSVEMSSLFKNVGVGYEPKYMNPVSRTGDYIMSPKKALNLGVYAVDLSYSKVFEQYDKAGKYLASMHQLSEELGIPSDEFYNTTNRIEKNITNKDSLYKIANEIYTTTDNYLKENDREGAASLIILGGWIEAMHIATAIVADGTTDPAFLDRITEQKHSLQDLIDLLENYSSNETVAGYLDQLKKLQPDFSTLTIDYSNPEASAEQVKKIGKIINKIRTEIVS